MKLTMGLVRGRHEIPQVEEYIFEDSIENPTKVGEIEDIALNFLSGREFKAMDLYVTGLTVALIAALNAARRLDIAVTLYHFDRETGEYFPQCVK